MKSIHYFRRLHVRDISTKGVLDQINRVHKFYNNHLCRNITWFQNDINSTTRSFIEDQLHVRVNSYEIFVILQYLKIDDLLVHKWLIFKKSLTMTRVHLDQWSSFK